MKELVELNLWTPEVRNQLIAEKGSIQNIRVIPQELKEIFKTTWEIKQKVVIDMAANRGAYICQSQSLNIHMAEPTTAKLTSMHFYAWKKGLKTGMYYLRTRPKADAIQFTVDQTALVEARQKEAAAASAKLLSTPPRAPKSNTSKVAVASMFSPDPVLSASPAVNSNTSGALKATQGLEYAPEEACDSCGA